MAAVKSPPSSSGALAFMSLLILGLLLPMAGPGFVSAQLAKEQAGYGALFGDAKTEAIVGRASGWFSRAFVETGIIARSMSTGDTQSGTGGALFSFAPPVKPKAEASGAPAERPTTASPPPATKSPATPSPGARFMRHWMGGFWSILYMAAVRLSAFVTTFPMILALGIAIMVEGDARRKLKWVMFGGSDPKRYAVGGMLAMWCPLLAGLSLVVPGRLPPMMFSGLLVIACLGYALWTSNQQKPM